MKEKKIFVLTQPNFLRILGIPQGELEDLTVNQNGEIVISVKVG